MDIQPFVTPGLGNSSWLLASGDAAVLVDPQRDVRRFLDAADRRGWRITHVIETHRHNDYVSGALEVRAATGAELVLPARGRYELPHLGADEGTSIEVGDLRLVAMATPGHAPEHLAWQVIEGGDTVPSAVFTGGSLLAGSAGRTDLAGPEMVDMLTRAQHATLHRLAALPEHVRVLPTHGSGSFCSAGPPRVERETSIGEERRTNPLLADLDVEAFRVTLLRDLGRVPAYFRHMGPINRAGAPLIRARVRRRRLPAGVVAGMMDSGVVVVDARDRREFARAHVPGSIHVEGTDAFSSWVGAVVPFGSSLVLVVPDGPAAIVDELVTQLRRVGYDNVLGTLDGGIDAWAETGRPLGSFPISTAAELGRRLGAGERPRILDVRQPAEWRTGTLPDSTTVFVGDLPRVIEHLDHDVEWTVVCRSGARASIAGSLLAGHGLRARVVASGGVPDLLHGTPSQAAILSVAPRSSSRASREGAMPSEGGRAASVGR